MTKRILVVDDDNAVRATICENLREWGFDVIEASNGMHACVAFDSSNIPDIIITDIIMPGMDGIGVIEEMRKRKIAAKIIAISGGSRMESEDFLAIAKRKGADLAFSKPLNLDQLESALGDLCQARPSEIKT